MEKRLRAGVVGFGSWARAAHLPALLNNPNVQVAAICDPHLVGRQEFAVIGASPRFFTSFEAMVDAAGLDLVCIVTPDDRHADQARYAIGAGLHVLCEKPLALTGREAWELTDRIEQARLIGRVGFTFRYSNALVSARELILGGEIGEPHLLVALQQNGQFLDPATPFHWKMDRTLTRAGAIVEYGVHTIDLANWLMGDIRRIQAVGQTLVSIRPDPDQSRTRTVEVDDSTVWMAEFSSGATGIGHAGWSTPGRAPGLEIRIFGSRGAVRVELSDQLEDSEAVWVSGPDGIFAKRSPITSWHRRRPWDERWMSSLIDDLISEIRGEPHRGDPTFQDGAKAQSVLDAAITSMETGQMVAVAGAG